MKLMPSFSLRQLRRAAPVALVAAGAWISPSWAADGTLADAPLFTSGAEQVKPNIMFILDNSGSMNFKYLPVAAQAFDDDDGLYGKWTAQCNGLAFDPEQKYELPLDHKGTKKPTPALNLGDPTGTDTKDKRWVSGNVNMPAVGNSITVSVSRGFRDRISYEKGSVVTVFKNATTWFVGKVESWNTDTGSLKIKVTRIAGATAGTSMGSSNQVGKDEPKSPVYYTYSGTQPRLGFTYKNGIVDTTTQFYKECASTIGSGDGAKVFTKVTVTPDSPEAQKYANWAAYYQDRMSVMQAAISFAFQDLDDRYRVGYQTINEYTEEDNFLDIKDFTYDAKNDVGHKKDFFDKLWKAEPNGGTPLRGALARAGQYYAKKLPGQTYDPIEYSCQRNFAILSTDGYWNTGRNIEEGSYGPFKLDRTNKVGQQDGPLPRPLRDGATVTTTEVETWKKTVTTKSKFETSLTSISGKRTVSTETETQAGDRTVWERGSGSCGWGRTHYVEVRVEGSRSRSRSTTTSTSRTETVDKRIEPVILKEVFDMKRTTEEVDGVTYPAQITETRNAAESDSTWRANGDPQVVAGSTRTLSNQTQGPTSWSSWSNWGNEREVGRGSSGCYWSKPADGSWDSGSTSRSTSTVGPTDYTDGPTAGSRTLVNPPDEVKVEETTPTKSTVSGSTGGQENTLADVAAYYYQTDLRTDALENCSGGKGGVSVCENNVPGKSSSDAYRSFGDSAAWQHMTTFTLGLGVNGELTYDPGYQVNQSGHFHEIVTGKRNWPAAKEAGGTESWPGNVDDLWHAAVNGRGQYFNANDPTSLTSAITSTLDQIKSVTGSASAASTSSLQPVAGDNDVFLAQFTTAEWYGDVLAYQIDPSSGAISKKAKWSAMDVLDKRATDRTIWYAKPAGGMEEFNYANLTAAGLQGKFDGFCSKKMANNTAPDQCANLAEDDLKAANDGQNLVDFLRGKTGLTYYRTRASRLGDIINASPLFVGRPRFMYLENGYQSFATGDASERKNIVLAAANDGMLHAFDRENGSELWAFIPSFVLDKLPRLADTGYSGKHTYMVDGSPVMGDVYVKGKDGKLAWRTVVVGGLNKGGRGYYALDVTDTEKPELLWEFTHDNLGYTYGNPIITKRDDGTWVVVFASGYENVSPGDGNGHLFVVDVASGTLLTSVSTFTDTLYSKAAGTTSKYSGLAKINAWVESETSNSAKRFYGGDLLGNLWRFDIDGLLAPKNKALLLAQLKHADDKPQPITTRPAVAELSYNGSPYAVVYVATGAYVREGDPADKTVQTVYAVKDDLGDKGYGDLRKASGFVVQEIKSGLDKDKRPTRYQEEVVPVRWSEHSGWRADFPVAGERTSVDPQLALDTLYVGSNLPLNDACTVGGDSFLYRFDIATGKVRASYVGNVLLMGITTVQLTTGENANSMETIVTTSKGELVPFPEPPSTSGGKLKRTSWRELVD